MTPRVPPWNLLAVMILCISLALGACGGQSPGSGDAHLGSSSEALTGVVKTSRTCKSWVKSGECWNVPPKPIPGCTPGPCYQLCIPGTPCIQDGVDGLYSAHEYDGASLLPYTDESVKAEASVWVKAFQYSSGATKGRGYLKVYLQDMPWIPYNPDMAEGKMFPVDRSPFYVVYVDFNRFTGPDATVGTEDRFIAVDVTGITPATTYRRETNGTFTALGTPNFHAGTCGPDSSTPYVWRCNGELEVPLAAGDMKRFASPDDDVDPGVGFAVYPLTFAGPTQAGLPEISVAKSDLQTLLNDRRPAISLLFAKPRGFKVQYMTWNIRRSIVTPLAGDFSKTPDDAVGTWLADKADVIALQEGWNKDKMQTVLAAAASRRSQVGLAPLYVAGPPDVDGGVFKDALSTAGQAFQGGDEGSSGGIWILSKFPIAQTDFHAYSEHACKGEDCLKTKSVFWARIMLNPPTPANTGCLGNTGLNGVQCDTPPSGGDFVDVFNTHLNATDTRLCQDDVKRDEVKAKVAGSIASAGLALPALQYLQGLIDNDLNCSLSDETVQRKQLDEMDAFISSHMSKDRPAVVMGDFNIDGRQLGDTTSLYRDIIRRLHIGPNSPTAYGGNTALENDDVQNPWPIDFDWDIDHGDLARQFNIPYPTDGRCMGTFIGTDPTDLYYNDSCAQQADKADGKLRYDYILVRPPYQSDDPNFKSASWVAEKVATQPWHSPYPGPAPVGTTFSGPPDRLSDHKPVQVGLEHAKLEMAPNFHASWKHNVELRAMSYDASNVSDCWTCSDVDPYASLWAAYFDQNGDAQWTLTGNDSEVCGNTGAASFPSAGCMANWNATFAHQGTRLRQA